MPWRPIRRVPWPSRSPTRARKILPFLLFLIKKVINYTFRSVPMSFLHFAFVFRAREGAHALEENPDRTGTVHVDSPMLSEDGLEYTKAPSQAQLAIGQVRQVKPGELQPAARVARGHKAGGFAEQRAAGTRKTPPRNGADRNGAS